MPISCFEGPVHHTVVEVVRFVEERIKGEDSKESHALRGPYLARLELYHRLRERGCSDEKQLGKTQLFKFQVFLLTVFHFELSDAVVCFQ